MSRKNGDKGGSILVAIDKDKGSQFAFKWAVDNLLPRCKTLILLHVRVKPPSSPTSKGSKHDFDEESLKKEMFLPFRCFCTRRHMECDEVIVEGVDASKGILDYVQENAIENLVLGAPAKGGLLKFRTTDVPSTVSKAAPTFCSIYVINKGKVAGKRPATNSPPEKPAPCKQLQSQTSIKSYRSDVSSYQSSKAGRRTPGRQLDAMDFQSPFSRKGYIGKYQPSVADSDISFVSDGRSNTTESMFPSFLDYSEPEIAPRFSTGSEFEANRSSFGSVYSAGQQSMDLGSMQSDFYGSPGQSERSSCSRQSMIQDDVESEMIRLKKELKQTMDMYSNACKEALVAKQKATELNQWKLEKEQKLEDAKLTEESVMELVEREKAKSRGAMEAAAAAQRMVELESQKRKQLEMKAMKELEMKNRFMSPDDFRYRKYTIEEIEQATDHFAESRKLGEGGYGTVYLGRLDHTPVAIKVLRNEHSQGLMQFQQEVEVLTCLRHPNMVLLVGACPEHGSLVYEHMPNGSLGDRLFRLGNTPPIPWQVRFRIAAEITTGLLFLHQTKPQPIVHRDLKPANILLDRNFVSKIADVGLARLVPRSVADMVTQYRMTATAGTFCYIDPEYQQSGMLGTKSDVYSLGIVLLQIITARQPMGLTHLVENAIKNGTFQQILDPTVQDWPVEEALRFAKLALQCAELRRKDRPDLAEILLPELNRLRELGEEAMPMSGFGAKAAWSHGGNDTGVDSTASFQEAISDSQTLPSGSDSSISH